LLLLALEVEIGADGFPVELGEVASDFAPTMQREGERVGLQGLGNIKLP